MSAPSAACPVRRAGLLGRRLGHSLSPQVHRFFGDYAYRLHEKEPEEVASFLDRALRSDALDFLNVTIPYKQTVFALCDELSPTARQLGNVNFVRRLADGRLFGDNTDAFGVGRLLDAVGADVRGCACAVLGAGGAALTTRAVLEARGAARVTLVCRGETPAADDEVIVNATPVGMFPNADDVRLDIAAYPRCRVVLDLVYSPSPTRLVREARACGKKAADGLVMLIAQAYRAYRLAAGAADAPASTLFLYGPPASGKSTWGHRLAQATDWAFVDLDAEIETEAGRRIPEIFAAEGEDGFRAIERRCLARLCAAPPVRSRVVALGGGALLDRASRERAEAAGRIVLLDCPPETLKARLTGGDRPLSADAGRLEALLRARAAHYASFPTHLTLA